jgi:DNA-binding CsgD family transcriptional regulator/tetratricopeptide (TPR) repeat protein
VELRPLERARARAVRAALGVRGGWTLEAAEAVGAGGGIGAGEVLDVLSGLVDKSLVVAEEAQGSGASRYGMLEPVRQYARELLEGNEAAAQEARRRHALWCLALAEEAEPGLTGAQQQAWTERLEPEHDNLRAALSWLLERGEAELGLRLVAVTHLLWGEAHGHLSERRAWLERAISASGTAAPRTRAKVFKGAAWVAQFQGESGAAKAYGEEALALSRELEDEEGIATAVTCLGFTAIFGQRADIPVVALLKEAMELRPKLIDHSVIGNLLRLAGIVAVIQSDLERGIALLEEALALAREAQNPYGISALLNNLGLVALGRTDYDKAFALLRESLHKSWETSHKPITQYSLFGLAGVAARGQPARAARLWGAEEAMMEAIGMQLARLARSATDYDVHRAVARSRLGEEAFAAAWSEGKAMPLEEAVEYALSEDEVVPTSVPPREEPPASSQPASLTRREEEVAALVALGFTNRRIAKELSISEHTAEHHVRNILKKLGLRSRAQIAALVAQRHGPPP